MFGGKGRDRLLENAKALHTFIADGESIWLWVRVFQTRLGICPHHNNNILAISTVT